MHNVDPSYMFNAGDEYNLLNDFLSTSLLDENLMYGNEDFPGVYSDPLLINEMARQHGASNGQVPQSHQPSSNASSAQNNAPQGTPSLVTESPFFQKSWMPGNTDLWSGKAELGQGSEWNFGLPFASVDSATGDSRLRDRWSDLAIGDLDNPLFKTGATAQNNQSGVVPYQRDAGTLSKAPDDGKGIVDLGQRRSPFLREGRLFDLPLLLGDQEILVVPDTGAQINAISVQTLKRLRGQFQSQWGSLDDVVNVANSSSTDAICQVAIHCRLAQASQYYQSCVFHVFSELASGVMAIMGRAFLDAAQVLTTRSYLLRERVDHLQYIPRCMSIGPLKSSGLRLPVYLDSKLITAFPDTGSEIDLISRACALLHRFDIQQLQSTDKSVVQFADGQIDTLSGKVRVKFDTFTEPVLPTRSMLSAKRDEQVPLVTPSSKRRKTSGTTYLGVASSVPPDHHKTFYVLDSLPYDVVLSQSLLHSIDAFNLHASGFTTVTSEENKKEICTVFWYRGKEYKAEETR
jgi:hypothetical protein